MGSLMPERYIYPNRESSANLLSLNCYEFDRYQLSTGACGFDNICLDMTAVKINDKNRSLPPPIRTEKGGHGGHFRM